METEESKDIYIFIVLFYNLIKEKTFDHVKLFSLSFNFVYIRNVSAYAKIEMYRMGQIK